MTDRPQTDRLRADIAQTRADMDRKLAMIEDRVSPSRIKDRQVDRVRSRWQRARQSVMGTAESAGEMADRAGESAQEVAGAAREAPDRVEDTTRGNPLAAGLVAFGLGALAGGLAPASDPERRLAGTLRDEFEEPVRGELQQAGQEVRDDLQEHAQQAMDDTKQTAQRAADRTTGEARERAQSVRSDAEEAAQDVKQRG